MNWLQRIWSLIFGPPPAPVPPPVPTPTDDDRWPALAVHRIINEARTGAGLAPYVWSEGLAAACERHAIDMGRARRISHDGFSRRLAAANYEVGGECVAEGQPTAAAVVVSWLGSPGHRAILLEPRYTDVGVAAAKVSDGRIYWCLLAGRREG